MAEEKCPLKDTLKYSLSGKSTNQMGEEKEEGEEKIDIRISNDLGGQISTERIPS